MPITTTATRSSNHNHQHHHQRQASAGAGTQLVVVVVAVLDLRMVVVEVSGTCYLLPGMRRDGYVCSLCMLAFPGRPLVPGRLAIQHDQVSRTRYGLGHDEQRRMAMLLSGLQKRRPFRNRWSCRARDRRQRTYHMILVSERGLMIQPQQRIKVVEQPSWWPRRQARCKYELYYANL